MKLYPLFFKPLFKYRLWGGEKLRTHLKKEYEGTQIGESWEISDVEDSETRVSNGALKGKTLDDLIETYGADFLGASVINKFGTDFPLLIKFLDAKTPLSVQVHPDDETARERHNSFGKNEMWYIMQADDKAEIIVGFKENTDKDTYKKAVAEGNVLNLLNIEQVKAGDLFHIPTGRVHAIGAGVLLAEIQQTSDITYRIYDYDRVDAKTGKTRDLHNDLAVDVIDFKGYQTYKTDYELKNNTSDPVISTPYFNTNIISVGAEVVRDYSEIDSFVVLMCVEGSAKLLWENESYYIKMGQTMLLPATITKITLRGTDARLLEVTV